MTKIRLVIFDLDCTLWDHDDASTLRPPFRLENEDTIIDANGIKLKLFPGVREVLEKLRKKNKFLAVASWNKYSKVIKILKALKLDRFFDVICIEDHPFKDNMLLKILGEFRKRGILIKPNEVIFVDDRELHKKQVVKFGVIFVQMWKDVKSFQELLEFIQRLESKN